MPDITMPQLGETVTEGTIIRWMKKVGDEIAYDEPLFEVSTDKVDSEVPSPAAGYLAEILVAEGATVDVGTKLAVVTDDGSLRRRPAPRRPRPQRPAPPRPLPPEPAPEAVAAASPCPSQSRPGPHRGRRGAARERVERQGAGAVSRCPPTRRRSTASTRPRCRGPARAAGSPGQTCSRSSTGARPAPVRRRAGRQPQRAGGEGAQDPSAAASSPPASPEAPPAPYAAVAGAA